jgi:hypothetical protein
MGGVAWNNTFMANGLRRRATATLALMAAAAPGLALAACGGDGTAGAGHHADRPASTATARPAAAGGATTTATEPVDLDPEVTGRELLRLQRIGPEPGAHDLLKYGSDGSAVIVQAYGGGGERIRVCTLRPDRLDRLRADLRALPLGPERKAPPRKYVSLYTNSPARYTLVAGATHASFNDDTMPRDARPLVRLLEDTLYRGAATCRTTYRSRAS